MKRIIKCFLIALLIVIILIAAIAIRNMLILKKLLSLSNSVNKNNYHLITTIDSPDSKTIFDAYYKNGNSFEKREAQMKSGEQSGNVLTSYYYKKDGEVVVFYEDGTIGKISDSENDTSIIFTIDNSNMLKNIYLADSSVFYRARLLFTPITKDTYDENDVYVFVVGKGKLYVDAETGLTLHYVFDKDESNTFLNYEYDFSDIDDSIFDYENSDNLKKE